MTYDLETFLFVGMDAWMALDTHFIVIRMHFYITHVALGNFGGISCQDSNSSNETHFYHLNHLIFFYFRTFI